MPKRRHPAIPPGANVPLRLESCPREGVIRVRFLGPWRGALIHKPKKDVQVACPGAADCPAAMHRSKTQWKGFAPAEWWREGQYQDWCPCVFEITQHLGELMHGAELRGTIWRIERRVGEFGANEVHGEMIGEVDGDSLRPPFTVLPTIVRVFGTVDIALDVPPNIPPRLILPPIAGGPPPDLVEPKKAKALGDLTMREMMKQQLAAGTLPEQSRKRYPDVVAKLEAELRAERR